MTAYADCWFDAVTHELVGVSPLPDDAVLPRKLFAIRAPSVEEAKKKMSALAARLEKPKP